MKCMVLYVPKRTLVMQVVVAGSIIMFQIFCINARVTLYEVTKNVDNKTEDCINIIAQVITVYSLRTTSFFH